MTYSPRAANTRDATSRASIGGDAKGRLDIDMTGIPPDMEATWIRETLLGQRDDNNVSDALNRQGYDIVSPSILTNFKRKRLPDDKSAEETIVRSSGHILMMRPKVYAEEDRAEQREEVKRQQNAAIRVADVKGANLGSEAFREVSPNVEVRHSGAGRPRGFKE